MFFINKIRCLIFCGIFIVAGTLGANSIPAQASESEIIEDQIIVKYHDDLQLNNRTDKTKIIALEKANDLEKIDEITPANIRLLKTADNAADLIENLKKDPKVETAEPNIKRNTFIVSNDTYFNYLWSLNNTGQTINEYSGIADADLDVPEAWEMFSSLTFQNVPVAIIDTGVRYDHNDLAANMWNGASCKNELNQTVVGGCPYHGWDYSTYDNNPMDDGDESGDSRGHGTHVSGIIGAVANNSYGNTGLSLQNNLKLMAIRFGFTNYSEIKAIYFAKYNGAKVINASFGGSYDSTIERDAIAAFDGLFVAAAGNGGADQTGDNNDAASNALYPCNYDLANIICVAATDQQDKLADFSNYGTTSVDVGAPGDNNLSTYANSTSSFAYMSGTSMATPHVAALAAIIYSVRPSYTTEKVKNLVIYSGDRISSLVGKIKTEKRINLFNALSVLDDVSGPVISSPSPSGMLSSQNQPVYIQTTTDEPSICRYATGNVAFDSMPNTFSTTGQTTHTSLLYNLYANNNYTYYVKCRDRAGNDNAAAYTVTFATSADFIALAESQTINTTNYVNKKLLRLNYRNVIKNTLLTFNGTASLEAANGSVYIYQGRSAYKLKRIAYINSQGNWMGRFRSKKGSYLLKIAYYNSAGQKIKDDGTYYTVVKKKKK